MTDVTRQEADPAASRTGVWFVGARGSVASTAIVGALALRSGLARLTGLVSELPEVAAARLPGLSGLVFGGHDIATISLPKRVEALAAAGVIPHHLPEALASELAATDEWIRPGVHGHDRPQRATAESIEADLRAFGQAHGLSRIVVVDVSSTEPPAPEDPALTSAGGLERALDAGAAPLPVSSLYAYAAFRAGCPLVAFTPSPGPRVPAVQELARERSLPWAGSDGKTGETLVKTALAPMFASRALNVLSWASVNLLGGGDGQTLADPATAASKTATKGRGLEAILGRPVDGPLHIDFVPDFGEWKTAWDHVSFEGFLGTRMSLQFTWAGCDSALAAPLVLDLVRLVARAHDVGEAGPLAALGFFFKDPAGSAEHRLSAQWDALIRWCARIGESDEAG